VANAVAGLVACNNRYGSYDFRYRGFIDDSADDPAIARTERAKRAFMKEWGKYMESRPQPPRDLLAQIERLKAQRRNACCDD
jgi:hypothetical protein